jgi:hypothetical protein
MATLEEMYNWSYADRELLKDLTEENRTEMIRQVSNMLTEVNDESLLSLFMLTVGALKVDSGEANREILMV